MKIHKICIQKFCYTNNFCYAKWYIVKVLNVSCDNKLNPVNIMYKIYVYNLLTFQK